MREEIAVMFAELSLGETGGVDGFTAACMYHTERWEDYEAERKAERERNPGFERHERERWARANATRKKKRRGLHLSNAERVRLADLTSADGMTAEQVAEEAGVSVATAQRIGQLGIEWAS